MQKPVAQTKLSRRKFLAGALGASAAGIAHMKWLEPRWLGIGRHEVKLGAHEGSPIRLLQLSDFHASEQVSLEFIQSAVEKGLKLKPDLICLTGDFITWRYDAFPRYAEILKPLADAAPAFATLGNHDGGRWVGTAGYRDTSLVRDLLARSRIELLHNRSTTVQIQGRKLDLVGVGDWWAEELDAETAFSGLRNGSATILLSHNPDTKDQLRTYPWDLMLCGHTHGGQCDLVFFGTPFAPVRDKRYVRGLHRWNDRWIHITKGVGNLHGMRLNCRPEISLLTLT
jgi:predicted MPP superfamily phosphohydrolase